ncbi:glycosyltransferase [Ferrimonas balearica]|nr:glycosyltransferase [Ferrimonas balearica]
MTDELVSIIIPCYNNSQFVSEAINSALSQTHSNVEVIVVNDGSTDDSDAEISTFGNRVTYLTQENSGACVARNKGLAHSGGTFIKFLDADDILLPDCVQAQLFHAKRTDAVIFGDCILLHEDGTLEHHPTHLESSGLIAGDNASLATFLNNPVLTSTTMFRRAQLERLGGFDPTVRRGQEHELHLRLYNGGVDFEYHPEVCYQYRQHFSPSRISVSSRNVSHFRMHNNFLKLIDAVRDGERKSDWETNRRVLGRTAWRTGRRHLRAGDYSAAKMFFNTARELGGYDIAHGTSSYRFLRRFLGPIAAEKVSMLRHQIRSPFKPMD